MLHQVGVGVLGPVFRTYDPVRDRLISVKAFQLDLLPEQAQALAAELARLVALDLTHPSIVHRVAAGVEGHTVYLAEDYVAAESLDIALRHYAPAPLETALPFIRQLAGAVDAARAAGVGHGALHPRDIFLTPEEARATGFGVAGALEAVGVAPPVRRPYSAPERIAGGGWGTAADVYALGAVAHELLTGRRPAGTGEVAPIAGKTAASHPQLIRAVLALALAEDPADRYQTAAAFADALEAAARGETLEEPARTDDGAGEARIGRSEPVLHLDRGGDAHDRPFAGGRPEPRPAAAEPAPVAREEEPSLFELEMLDKVAPSPSTQPWSARRLDPPEPEPEPDAIEWVPEPEPEPEPDAVEQAEEPEPDEEAAPAAVSRLRFEGEAEEADAREDDAGEPPYERPEQGPMWSRDEAEAPADVVDRGRGVILPLAGMLVIGLLVGFLSGYGLGSRERGPEPAMTDAETAVAPASPAEGEPAQPFSEAAVEEPPAAPPAQPTPPAPAVTPPAPPAEAPAPAEPAGARLVVRSTPAGARVRVNGAERGVTPLTLRGLAFGAYGIEVRREGYRNASRQITLSEQLPTRELTFQLERAETPRPAAAAPPPAAAPAARTGTLVADSRPRGARVFVDDRPVGTTPLRLTTLTAGRHDIRFELAGYRPWRSAVTIVEGRETRVSGSLERELE